MFHGNSPTAFLHSSINITLENLLVTGPEMAFAEQNHAEMFPFNSMVTFIVSPYAQRVAQSTRTELFGVS